MKNFLISRVLEQKWLAMTCGITLLGLQGYYVIPCIYNKNVKAVCDTDTINLSILNSYG